MAWLGGCDISKWQGSINWPALDPGTAFVVIKASGGDDGLYRDSQLTANQTGARSIAPTTGVGYYHFAGGGDPVAEADYFLEQVGDLQEGEFLALDWEIGHADPVGWCTAFVNEVHTKTNVWPLLYVNASTLNGYAWTPVTANCGVWVADWAVSPDANVATSYTYVMQQYKDNGTFPGIAGNVDSDAFFGTLDELRMYGYKATPSPSPTPAPPATPPTPVIVPAQPQQGSGTNNEQGTVIDVVKPMPTPKPTPTPVAPVTPVTSIVSKPVVSNFKKEETLFEKFISELGKPAKYSKFYIAVLGVVMAYLTHKYGNTPWLTDVVYALTAAGVYVAPNVKQTVMGEKCPDCYDGCKYFGTDQAIITTHHLYYPACDYKTRVEKEFRNLEVNKIAICRAIHDEIHATETPPDKPDHQFMCEEVREHLRR